MVALSTLSPKDGFLCPAIAPGLFVVCDLANVTPTTGFVLCLVVNEMKVIEIDGTSQVEPSPHRVYAPVI